MKHTLTHHETAASPARSERSKSRIYPCFDSGYYVNRERPGQGGNLSRAGQHADCWHPLTWGILGISRIVAKSQPFDDGELGRTAEYLQIAARKAGA